MGNIKDELLTALNKSGDKKLKELFDEKWKQFINDERGDYTCEGKEHFFYWEDEKKFVILSEGKYITLKIKDDEFAKKIIGILDIKNIWKHK